MTSPIEWLAIKPAHTAAAILGTAVAIMWSRPIGIVGALAALSASAFMAIAFSGAVMRHYGVTEPEYEIAVVGALAAAGPFLVALAMAAGEKIKSDPLAALQSVLARVLPARKD